MLESDNIFALEVPTTTLTESFLNRLNSISVTTEDILDVVAEGIRDYQEDAPQRDPGLRAVARLYASQPRRAPAIYFRLQALAHFIKEDASSCRGHGWLEDGAVAVHEAIFTAAAVHPLTSRKGLAVFEQESFLNTILELAEPLGRG